MSDINYSMPPEYPEIEDSVMDKHMMTGDKCADKAIMAGKNPDPPSAEYEIEDPEDEYEEY